MNQQIFVLGGGGFSAEVIEAISLGIPSTSVAGVYDDNEAVGTRHPDGPRYLGSIEDFVRHTPPDAHYVIAIGSNETREKLDRRCREAGKRPVTVIHPTACVSPTAQVGEGTYIAAFVFVGPRCRIGRHALLNVGASVGHGAELRDYVQVCPGGRISGDSILENGAFVGSNAVIPPRGRMGAYSKISAGSFAPRLIPAGRLAVGVPARLV